MIHFFFPLLLGASNLSINKTWALTPEIPVSLFKALHRTQIVGIELVEFSCERITLYLIDFFSITQANEKVTFFSQLKLVALKMKTEV